MYCTENCGLLLVACGKHYGGTWYYRMFRKADTDEKEKENPTSPASENYSPVKIRITMAFKCSALHSTGCSTCAASPLLTDNLNTIQCFSGLLFRCFQSGNCLYPFGE